MGIAVYEEHHRHLYRWLERSEFETKISSPIEDARKLFMAEMMPDSHKEARFVIYLEPQTGGYRDAIQMFQNLALLSSTASDTVSTDTERVFEALNNPRFEWRTIPGIAQETGLDSETIEKVLSESKNQVVRSSRVTKDGCELFTTRLHFREFASPWTRLIGALKNRVD